MSNFAQSSFQTGLTYDGKENIYTEKFTEICANHLSDYSMKKFPLRVLDGNNKNLLLSGAQRVVVKNKDSKVEHVDYAAKTNFMKPTDSFRNGRNQMTPTEKSTVKRPVSEVSSASKKQLTPTSITHTHSSMKPRSQSQQASTLTPKRQLKPEHGPVYYSNSNEVTPLRNKATTRSTSTPPSARKPSLVVVAPETQTNTGRKVLGDSKAKKADSVSLRGNVMQTPPAAHFSTAQTILFSPSHLSDDHEFSVMQTLHQSRAQSAPRIRSADDRSEIDRLRFLLPDYHDDDDTMDTRTAEKKKTNPKVYDMRQPAMQDFDRRSVTPKRTSAASETDMIEKPSNVNQVTSQKASRSVKPAVPSFKVVSAFKNPPPSSLLVTTADMLSANKAAKKAVIASFKAGGNVTSNLQQHHHYSAATQASIANTMSPALQTPNRKPKTPQSGTAQHQQGVVGVSSAAKTAERKPAIPPSTPLRAESLTAVMCTPERTLASGTPLSVSKSPNTALLTSSGKKLKKKPKKKVTISAISPTVFNSATKDDIAVYREDVVVRMKDQDALSSTAAAAAAAKSEAIVYGSTQLTQLQSVNEENIRRELDVKRSFSFGSEFSSVRGGGNSTNYTDISFSDTINLSANTSGLDSAIAAGSPSFDLDTTNLSSFGRGNRRDFSTADSLARLALDEALLDLSAVEPPHSRPTSTVSALSMSGIFSSFTPILPPPPPQSGMGHHQSADHLLQQSRRPSRHNHNTATAVTSRSKDFSSFFSEYSADVNLMHIPTLSRGVSSGDRNVLLRRSLTPGLTPIERNASQHFIDFVDSPQYSRQNSHTSFDSAVFVDCSAQDEMSSILNRGMLQSSVSVDGDSVSVASSTNPLNQAMCMSHQAFEFSPKIIRTSIASQFSLKSFNDASQTLQQCDDEQFTEHVSLSSVAGPLAGSNQANLDPIELSVPSHENDADHQHLSVEQCQENSSLQMPVTFVDDSQHSAISVCEADCADSTFEYETEAIIHTLQERKLDYIVLNGSGDISLDAYSGTNVHYDSSDGSSSPVNAIKSLSLDGSSGDVVNMASCSSKEVSTTASDLSQQQVEKSAADDGEDEVDTEGPFVFYRRECGELDDSVLQEEGGDDEEEDTRSSVSLDTSATDVQHVRESLQSFIAAEQSVLLTAGNDYADTCFIQELSCQMRSPQRNRSGSDDVAPRRMNVSDSFEQVPRSMAALPVPVTLLTSTPVTKNYMDFENKNSQQQQHQQEQQFNDNRLGDFVSTLPKMRSTVENRADCSNINVFSNASFTSNSRFSQSSYVSCTSSVDELQNHHPRVRRTTTAAEQWGRAEYGLLYGGASCVLDTVAEPESPHMLQPVVRGGHQQYHNSVSCELRENSLHLEREDEHCCPDPLAQRLYSDDCSDDDCSDDDDVADNTL